MVKIKAHVRNRRSRAEKEELLNRLIFPYGFAYDAESDTFFGREDGWQKEYGYHPFYDKSALAMGMVIDCEPIVFSCREKEYMIELWKGQYGICAGGEIGFYQKEGGNFRAMDKSEIPSTETELLHGEEILFCRSDRSWWVTGFCLGRFCPPVELEMSVSFYFIDYCMAESFAKAVEEKGYPGYTWWRYGNHITLFFDRPYSRQPVLRQSVRYRLWLFKLRWFCRIFSWFTGNYDNSGDKILYLSEKLPWLFRLALRFGERRMHFEQKA